MNGRGFRSVMWVAAIGAAALICYMFSLRVAEERAGLAELDGQIRRAEQSIRTLKTELGTRSRVHQLQHWASADFGFVAPTAGQFLQDEVTLASLDMPAAEPAMEAPVRMAAAPAAPATPPAAPAASKPVRAVAPAPAPARPAVRQASAAPAADRALLRQAAAQTPAARPKPAKPAVARTPAARPAALVNARTAEAIERGARAERASARTAGRPR
jgi:hypothetical protein